MHPSESLEKAIGIAALYHKGQTGKDGLPYILHPLHVMGKMPTLQLKAIAVMHDLVEDTTVTLEQLIIWGFSPEIVDAINALSRREGESYAAFIERCAVNPLAKAVKIEDLRHNLDRSRLPNLDFKVLQREERYKSALARLKEKGDG